MLDPVLPPRRRFPLEYGQQRPRAATRLEQPQAEQIVADYRWRGKKNLDRRRCRRRFADLAAGSERQQ